MGVEDLRFDLLTEQLVYGVSVRGTRECHPHLSLHGPAGSGGPLHVHQSEKQQQWVGKRLALLGATVSQLTWMLVFIFYPLSRAATVGALPAQRQEVCVLERFLKTENGAPVQLRYLRRKPGENRQDSAREAQLEQDLRDAGSDRLALGSYSTPSPHPLSGMPVETLRPSDGRMAGAPFTSAMPFRILNKGPDYFRRPQEPGTRKLSAVERLEADKAKYVKSQQVASTKQEPVKPPIIRKPLLSPSMLLQCRINSPPARKVPRRPGDPEASFGDSARRGTPLNLEILNNLINVCDTTPPPSSSASPMSASKNKLPSGSPQQRNGNSSTCSSSSSSPLNKLLPDDQNQRPPPVPMRAVRPAVYGSPAGSGSPNTVTVRRVDVRPQAEMRKPQRMPLQPQVPKRQVAQPQAPPPPQPQQPQPQSQPAPVQPASAAPPPPLPQPCLPTSPLLLRGALPPASPAFTRLSSTSSRSSRRDGPGSGRKHPSLHRSKSDLSDRFSRATADLERFFNYCGLDPEEVEGMGGVERFARASSDIVSVSKLRSVSTPSSECGAPSQHSRPGQDEDAAPVERAPYGISVIERNARVIKWLYGIRQARDTHSVSNV
ncbi:hypothetical protein JZ751_014586 [Albula glossodonta]|uniref:Family with sequence similarity 110 member A n=1 Tax=Albula glossodonta TaxID=121402 RepID=A0A8T2N3S5_9TELE|nr:hypothetical protein JZ751_014586 [Albula glossodonta]